MGDACLRQAEVRVGVEEAVAIHRGDENTFARLRLVRDALNLKKLRTVSTGGGNTGGGGGSGGGGGTAVPLPAGVWGGMYMLSAMGGTGMP